MTQNGLILTPCREGHRAFATGRYGAALKLFMDALGRDPTSIEAWNGRAFSELALHKIHDAICSLKQSLSLHSDQPPIRIALATAHLNVSDYRSAEVEALAVLDRNSNDLDAQHILGVAALRQSQFESAVLRLSAAAAQRPQDLNLKANLAAATFGAGDLDRAFDLFSDVEIGAPDLTGHGTLGSIVLLLGRLVRTSTSLALDSYLSTAAMAPTEQRELLKSCVLLLQRAGRRQHASEVAAYWANFLDDDCEAAYTADILSGKSYQKAPACFITSYFDGYADRFDHHLLYELHYAAPALIEETLAKLLSPEPLLRVLDAGCGTGLLGGVLSRYAAWLEGADLSPRMLEKAHDRKVYDALVLDDLVTVMGRRDRKWDVVVAADVFIYIGDLEDVASAARAGLVTGGLLIFSIEASHHCDGFSLQDNARFCHSAAYVAETFRDGFSHILAERMIIRREGGNPVMGDLFVFRRGDPSLSPDHGL